MCDEKNSENDKISNYKREDEDMNSVIDIKRDFRKDKVVARRLKASNDVISRDAIKDLMKNKAVIKCKDGVAQIDKDHPDYNFWIED